MTALAMTADGTDDNHILIDDQDGLYTFIDLGDGKEPPDNPRP